MKSFEVCWPRLFQAECIAFASLDREEGNWSSLNEGSLTFREQPSQTREGEKGEGGREELCAAAGGAMYRLNNRRRRRRALEGDI